MTEDIWPHLGSFADTDEAIDEVEQLLNRQIKLVQFQYKNAFENIVNKEEFERTELRQRMVEQAAIGKERYLMYFNFRLWLVEAFVRINRWDLVEDVVGRIYQWKLDLTIHPPLLRAMMEALDWLIEPLYKGIVRAHKFHSAHDRLQPDSAMYSPDQPGLRQADSPRVLFEELSKVIKLLNVNIALNQSVFYRVTLVVKHYQREAPEIAQRLAGEVFMPALALIDNRNEQVTSNIWDVLAETEFSKRYEFYSKMITETYLQNVSLIQVLV